MRLTRILLPSCLHCAAAAVLLFLPACDFAGGGNSSRGTVNPDDPDDIFSSNLAEDPLLLAVEFPGEGVNTGDEITLVGVNFSSFLSDNVVTFRSGTVRIRGLPLAVEFPSDGRIDNGLESRLRVSVPGGVTRGRVDLRVGGQVAGSRGISAAPEIMAVALGPAGNRETLVHLGPLGFDNATSTVRLYGINFPEIDTIRLEDPAGNVAEIPLKTVQRLSDLQLNPGLPPTGYSAIAFRLGRDFNSVRLGFPEGRSNLRVRVRGPGGWSNPVEVPVVDFEVQLGLGVNPARLGVAISGVKMPTGVRTGSVQLRYVLYALEVSSSLFVDVDWKLVDEKDDAWRAAEPDESDPRHDGTRGVLAGSFAQATGHALLPGPGAVRIFTWDPRHDAGLCQLIESSTEDGSLRRHWPIHFRVRIRPDAADPQLPPSPPHEWVTPPILYYYMEGHSGDDEITDAARQSQLETFANTDNRDNATSAIWGPPDAPEVLRGGFEGGFRQDFGTGTQHVVLDNDSSLPDSFEQFWTIDTDRLTITHVAEDAAGTPNDPNDDIRFANRLDFVNPGASAAEFHFATVRVAAETEVRVSGPRPLVVRLSGAQGSDSDDVVFRVDGKLVLDGEPGASTPVDPRVSFAQQGGRGGSGGPGGGGGGDGATLVLASLANGRAGELERATAGTRYGGEPGETTAAVHFSFGAVSKFWGAPGGGGGHRRAGGDGEVASPQPAAYHPPRPGRGGSSRGEPTLLEPTPGSGGGGGGATITRFVGGTAGHFAVGGAGGGGGAGVLHVIANGSIVISEAGRITANGGAGGNSLERALRQTDNTLTSTAMGGGAGGGGSGGSILLQALGSVDAPCDSLEAFGGQGGVAREQRGGSGAPGWIRVESGAGVPQCAALAAQTRNTTCMRAGDSEMSVLSTEGFPATGELLVVGRLANPIGGGCRDIEEVGVETIGYTDRTATDFVGLERGLNGSTPLNFGTGALVLLKGAVAPFDPGVVDGGGIVDAPDGVDPHFGADGDLHVSFRPTFHPVTGDLWVDDVTGEPLSIWVFDTDRGEVRRPGGDVVLRARSTEPNVLELSRLQVDVGTVLRGVGARPVVIFVAGEADVGGTIDVSGNIGGSLQFRNVNDPRPLPGAGAAGGPGGGRGGIGGTYRFEVVPITSVEPVERAIPVSGEVGGLPWGSRADWDQTPSPFVPRQGADQLAPAIEVTRATPGAVTAVATQDQPVLFCNTTGQGGGGGGNLTAGGDAGIAPPHPMKFAAATLGGSGQGGSSFGVHGFRLEGEIWTLGGTGGAGGGAHPGHEACVGHGHSPSVHASPPEIAPGTGGGGGGGVLLLVAENLFLRETGRLLARGGDAVQSVDYGGNGGGGAGGNVVLLVGNALSIAEGARIDVGGGRANLSVPIVPLQDLPNYPGNLHEDSDGELAFFGGPGGDGAPGRVRLEVDSLGAAAGANSFLSTGPFLGSAVRTEALSSPFGLGVGPTGSAQSRGLVVGAPTVRVPLFGQPVGASSVILWESAEESLNRHGAAGEFKSQVSDPRELSETEFVRFRVKFLSAAESGAAHVIGEIELPYRYRVREGCRQD